VATGVDEPGPSPVGDQIPSRYALEQNYPNPFNPSTTIRYELPQAGPVRLEVYNMIGQKVRTLVNSLQNAGAWTMQWNGRDDLGRTVSSGVYFYRLEASSVVLTKKMLLMK